MGDGGSVGHSDGHDGYNDVNAHHDDLDDENT